jgi:CHASE2 domain-containing sensor protein
LLIALLLCTGIVLAIRGQWLYRIDQTFYDRALSLWARAPQNDIVVIGIDEDSLAQIGRWPWRRAVHATLINQLTVARPKAIGFDVILTEPDNRDPNGDRVLSESIRANGRVVLPLIKQISDGGLIGDALPAPAYRGENLHLGHVTTTIDKDGILRRSYLQAGYGVPKYDQFALATWRLAEPDISAARHLSVPVAPVEAWSEGGEPFPIPFIGPPFSFRPLSYVAVLRGDYPAAFFRDKIVLIGMTASSMGDEFATPLSGESGKMAGVEIHANILQALREGNDIRVAGPVAGGTIAVTSVLLLLMAYLWLTPRQSLLATAGLILLIFLSSLVMFRYGAYWLSPALTILCSLLAYPLWSWRKLEATQRYFDDELDRLKSEPSVVPRDIARTIAPAATRKSLVPDVIEQRIVAVTSAVQHMRDLNRFVSDSLESFPDAALVVDAEARVLLANSSADRLFVPFIGAGSPARVKPLEGRNLFDLLLFLPPSDGPAWTDVWQRVRERNDTFSQEAKAANDQDYLVQMAPSFSHDGQRTGTIVALTDISPLRESERRRDEALRFLSHDMRSPQASILTLLEMRREHPDSMSTEKLIDRVDKYARRTLNLADDFLRLAKAERVRPQDFVPVNLGDIVREASEEAWSLASAKKIRVQAEIGDADAWVNGDRDLLTRVLMNLLSNAIKYSPPETAITCRLLRSGGTWRVDVSDQGYGIAEADMSRLFSRFTRLHTGTQPEEEGIGLGLVFVKTVVQRHGGTIDVTSKVANAPGDDHGTTFSVILPAADVPLE